MWVKILKKLMSNGHTTSNPRRFDVDITSIRQRPKFDKFPRHFRVISTYFFRRNFAGPKTHVAPTYSYVISVVKKFALLPRTLFDVISMVEKPTLFPRAFIGVISLVEKFTLFPRTFFDVILMVEKWRLFPRTFLDVICLVEICTLFLLTFFDVILMGKNSASFLVSCKLMKTFKEVFRVFVTLNSWLWQDCFL